jgi:hypothetical protein
LSGVIFEELSDTAYVRERDVAGIVRMEQGRIPEDNTKYETSASITDA